ncbi:MFS transporter [Nocardia sp. CDC159]|uniref:MFS transporter n=1 Tax=Nocardia pulmonis TaxID=2951408 RepID=A0A9X2IYZ3_9NOCA|nr:MULTISPECIES: MFS transporter [Nocardia]MCM6774401.1 MFS transporter [Nocardia pulmonis]MCM6787533.1 MFS transporter [Nocardia sp. CDC159]
MDQRAIVRRLLAGHGVNGFGDGLWFSIWAIYFTKIQGISPTAMGLAVGIGGAVGLVAAVPAGVQADHRGPREVLGVITLLRGLIMAGYILVADFWSLLLLTALFSAVQSSGSGVRVTLVYGLMPRDTQLRVLAQSRVVQHIAYSLGAGAAAIVLSVGTKEIFAGAVLLSGATFVVAAAVTMTVPSVPAVPIDRRRRSTQAIRDMPYVAIMASTAVLAICWSMLATGLPLWIADDTAAPLWTAALAVVVSSAAIALFQVRVTKGRDAADTDGAVRSTRISAAALALCCAVFAAAAMSATPVLATVVVMLGVCVHVVGEIYYVAARWGLSLGLMVGDAQGQYQGVTASTEAVAVAVGPALVTLLVAGLHGAGWLILGGLMLAAAVPTRALVRRALHDADRVSASV